MMSGLRTNHNQSFGTKQEWQSLSSTWPLRRADQERIETAHLVFTEGEPLPPSNRLLVILPDATYDMNTLPRRIWNLAAPDRRQVLLLTKPGREENELRSRVDFNHPGSSHSRFARCGSNTAGVGWVTCTGCSPKRPAR